MSQSQKRNVREAREKRQAARQAGRVAQAPIAQMEEPDRPALQRALDDPSMATPAAIVALQNTAGNRAVHRFVVQRQAPEEEEELQLKALQRQGGMLGRLKRIIARLLWKTLPSHVYRFDSRGPEVIAQQGFQPRDPDSQRTIRQHVEDNAGSTGSKYVSTMGIRGAVGVFFSQGKNLYKINTAFGRSTFTDVNDYYDRLGVDRPYPKQREWIQAGGIPGIAVEGYITNEIFTRTINGLPRDFDLENITDDMFAWQPMPSGVLATGRRASV